MIRGRLPQNCGTDAIDPDSSGHFSGCALNEALNEILGHTSAGVALFAAGVILSGYAISTSRQVLSLVSVKNIVQPGLVWAALYFLGYANPLLGEAVITAALPVVVLATILAVQYGIAEREAASALLLSMLFSLGTLAGFIALTG